jgi:glucosamine 6-phosphate synthetase-like amidotransferase/phosphosugar isomerase protein
MAPSLAVVVDGTQILHYDRNNPLPEEQQRSLEKMDKKMDQGISFGTQTFSTPGMQERAQYIANMLITALSEKNDPLAAATCAWLAVRMPDFAFDPAMLERITITACGTAYYAGMVAKYWIEQLAGLPVDVDVASEFRYRDAPLKKGGVSVVISQSGETADTLAALLAAATTLGSSRAMGMR